MFDWIGDNQALVWWVVAASVVMFVGTLLAIPVLIVRMPADYFVDDRPWRKRWPARHPAVHWTLVAIKNVVGLVLMVAGVAMLMLPGQGLLTLLVGLTLVDFPGKRRVELAIVRRKSIRKAIDWLRRRKGKEPLRLPGG